jgi:hypothetical protein
MQSTLLRIVCSTRSCRREQQAPRHAELDEITIGAVGCAGFLVGKRFLHLFDLGCRLMRCVLLSDED